jgi:glycine/sarcosine N-methyltransferase
MTAERILSFYETLAEYYHLIFDDWDSAIERQARILGPLLASETSIYPLKILDCACGIGTQAIGFAAMGHQVVASDQSPAMVNRARKEAHRRSLKMSFCVSDMTSLQDIQDSDFEVVAAMDNALPHLESGELRRAMATIALKLKRGGLFVASIRDYDRIILDRPTIQQPAFYGGQGDRRIVHQVWDWTADDRYAVHLYITAQSGQKWETHHFVSEYRCLLRDELSAVLRDAGFKDVRWLVPDQSGFYQPIALARVAS